ncbi:pyridoxine 5'-phosphate synthase [Rhodovibrio salinarum]|uniref:Pyridoxine 5'-phosphate synthase n=1 Tax=Rhodovibrio salinarum TaxID=1087 RepID=A0A934V0A1_9PROT|nr:pyridoxine 5'-phosphate synthase [Rhodovibrio salinarum]MBK1698007.1 pyridoxine 5'-phosphate synthase [Rhodovibrio salinarum]
MTQPIRLGVNIDHIATLRNARGGRHPDPLRAAKLAEQAGADGITAHLREDRRHIVDRDIERLSAELTVPLNLEMAATQEMLEIARQHRPHACCLVPERRAEVTTEGGLDVAGQQDTLKRFVDELGAAGARVSLFIDPERQQLEAAAAIGAPVVELHTGAYCDAFLEAAAQGQAPDDATHRELDRIVEGARLAAALGLECHAGHGLTFDTVKPVAALPQVVELNIGHFLIGEATFTGLDAAIRRMRELMDQAREAAAAAL